MKKKMIIVISIILILGFIFLILNRKQPNTETSNSNNNTITVTTNGGVPYSWEYNLSNENIVSIKKTSKPLNNNDGGPVSVYFDIIPKKEGTVILTLNYTSVVDMEIIETKKYSIEVDKNLKVKINARLDTEQRINNIISNGPSTSSNPLDYIKASKEEYNELLNRPRETFEYAIKDLIETNANKGLKSYIEALLCHDINENFEYYFDSASKSLEKYKEFLTKSYSIFNEYDKYALSLLTEYDSNETTNDEDEKEERYMSGYTFDDGKCINFAFDVPYDNDSLVMAFLNKKITLDEFISKLDYVDTLRDGESKIYKYNKNKKVFGNDDFYTAVCNSVDNSKDIYVAKHIESLSDKCSIKMNDLDGVSMTIKDGTLTRVGATIIITDVSDRNNVYGISYKLFKEDNGVWVELKPLIDNYVWTTKGYFVDESNQLEMDTYWVNRYGKLEDGEYRIVKSTSEAGEYPQHYITAEFAI